MDPRVAPLAVAGFLVALGLVVLLARPGAMLNRVLCAIFLLRGATTATFTLLRYAPDLEAATTYARLTVWYAVPHGLLLLALGVVLLRPPRLAAGAALALAMTATAALLAAHALVPGALVASVGPIPAAGTFGYESATTQAAVAATAVVLEAALALGISRAARGRAGMGLLALAFCFVPAHTGAFLAGIVGTSPFRLLDPGFALRAAASALALLLVGLALRALARGGAPGRGPLALLAATAALGLLGGVAATSPFLAGLVPSFDVGVALARGALGAVAAAALLRGGLAGMGEAWRARLARGVGAVVLACAAALGVALALAVLGRPSPLLQAAAPAVAAGALLLSPVPLRRLASWRGGAGDAGRVVGRYRLERELGRGATATAWLASERRRGGQVVVKCYHPSVAASALREAAALRGLRHPRVVPLLDSGRRGEEAWIAIPYYARGTLRDLLDAQGRLPAHRAIPLVADVAEALAHLHARGLTHRDVKAENVFLDAQGRGVLGDLGSARAADRDATLTGAASGVSLSGAAPEVLRGRPATAASDVYAAGALLHRLLTGRHYVALEDADAFQARERILLDAPRLPDARVPPGAEALLRACLAKRPEARPPSGAALVAALSRLQDEQRPPDADDVAGREGARLARQERPEVDAGGVPRAG